MEPPLFSKWASSNVIVPATMRLRPEERGETMQMQASPDIMLEEVLIPSNGLRVY
jgi:hypothetical protein